MEAFLADPTDLYLLRLAAGSIGGVLTNIDDTGANSMGFHADPANLFFDPASGDWGLALYGHAHTTASVLVEHDDFGWCCYFCDHYVNSASVKLVPRDSARRRMFIAPLGLDLVSEAGKLAQLLCILDATGTIIGLSVTWAPVGAQPLRRFRVRLVTRAGGRKFRLEGGAPMERGAYVVTPAAGKGLTTVNVTW